MWQTREENKPFQNEDIYPNQTYDRKHFQRCFQKTVFKRHMIVLAFMLVSILTFVKQTQTNKKHL